MGRSIPSLERLLHFAVRNKPHERFQGGALAEMADAEGNEMLREHGKNGSFAEKSRVLKALNLGYDQPKTVIVQVASAP